MRFYMHLIRFTSDNSAVCVCVCMHVCTYIRVLVEAPQRH
jgi:hypothetical protein